MKEIYTLLIINFLLDNLIIMLDYNMKKYLNIIILLICFTYILNIC